VGTPIAGVEVKISPEGEILVRGDNVSSGYLDSGPAASEDGWLHTGDAGSLDESGRLQVRGRLKEMIVTPEGMNVFPEDIERVLDNIAGVRESAVVGEERPHAVLVLNDGADPEGIVRAANARLENHQKIRAYTVWPGAALPRTEGTRKLKRREVRARLGGETAAPSTEPESLEGLLARRAPGRSITPSTTLDELGLTSLERIELMIDLERHTGQAVDEAAFSRAETVADLYSLPSAGAAGAVEFPSWNRSRIARAVRRCSLPTWILPMARIFARVEAHGLENLAALEPPVLFASNHTSHFDTPSIFVALPAKWRYRLAPAMSKEFFAAHFFPERHSRAEWFTNSLNYYLASLFFNAFPLPQRETGARQTVRYAGDLAAEGWCILIYPEGKITATGELNPMQPGTAMLASRLRLPVVPIRLRGVDRVLSKGAKFPRRGRVRVAFGAPLRLEGDDYAALTAQLEEAIRRL
jgi:long-chain acyl-CoA synthetase